MSETALAAIPCLLTLPVIPRIPANICLPVLQPREFPRLPVFRRKASPPVSDTEPAALLELLHRERGEQGLARKRRLQRSLRSFLLFCAAYLLLYFLGRIVWCGGQDTTVAGWLFTARPAGEHSYLFDWLLSSRLFWWAAAISALPSLFGKWKFSLVTLAGFVLGFFLGLVFGPNPAGEALGQGHYGWAIWGAVFLIACLAGGIVQKLRGKQ